MDLKEQQNIRQRAYKDAMRYIANAEDDLKNAGRDGNYYKDAKYVRRASGTAYNAVLLAMDAWLKLKEVELPKGKTRKTVDFYYRETGKRDKKLARDFDEAYKALHLSGYYDGTLSSDIIKSGFRIADSIINRIKPVEVA